MTTKEEKQQAKVFQFRKKIESKSNAALVKIALTQKDQDLAWEAIWLLRGRKNKETLQLAKELAVAKAAKTKSLGIDILGQLVIDWPFHNDPNVWKDKNKLLFKEEAFQIIWAALKTEKRPMVITSAAMAMNHLHDASDHRAVAALCAFKNHPNASVRYNIVLGLMGHNDPRAINALIQLSADKNRDVRNWATFALGTQLSDEDYEKKLDSPKIRAALLQRVSDSDSEIRMEALVGLAYRKDKRCFQLLFNEMLNQLDKYGPGTGLLEAAEELADERFYPLLLYLGIDKDVDSYWASHLQDALKACAPKKRKKR